MDQYKVIGRIGEGAHGLVLKAKHKVSGNEVALKKLLLKRMDDDIPIQIVREIKALQEIDCRYVSIMLVAFQYCMHQYACYHSSQMQIPNN